jgi:ecotin
MFQSLRDSSGAMKPLLRDETILLIGVTQDQRNRDQMKSFAWLAIGVCLTFNLCLFGDAAMGQESRDNLKAYPAPEAGMKRCVIHLESKANEESDYRIEVLVGKTVEVDQVNRYFFGGKLEEVTIEGWGFPKYVVKELGPMSGTRIAPDPSAPQVKRFVSLGGEQQLLRYNSRLPLVVYVPADAEVRLRVWKALPDPISIPQG